MSTDPGPSPPETLTPTTLPRISIQFCIKCQWMLRASWFAQELLSTFSTSLGEVALVPSAGGVFTVDIIYPVAQADGEAGPKDRVSNFEKSRLWDRKAEGGFPEIKHLKQLVRNVIDPTRDLGHADRHSKQKKIEPSSAKSTSVWEAPSATQISKSAEHGSERTSILDANAGIARGPPDEEVPGSESKGKHVVPGCQDCS